MRKNGKKCEKQINDRRREKVEIEREKKGRQQFLRINVDLENRISNMEDTRKNCSNLESAHKLSVA